MNETILLYSSTGCNYCAKIKADLKRWGLTYEERNVTENQAFFNDLHEKGIYSVPVTFVEETPIIGYRPNKMKQILGISEEQDNGQQGIAATYAPSELQQQEEIFTNVTNDLFDEVYDFVVIGSGPAGASAAVYASRGKLKTLVIDKAPASGALAITHKIANYPGVMEELTGLELVDRIRRQAKQYGSKFIRSQVLSVDFHDEALKHLELPEGTIQAKSVFVAGGSRGRTSKIKGEEEFAGRGVSYCSTCDAAFFQSKTIAVVGDNEEAVSEAVSLSKFAEKVLFMIPGKKLTGQANITDVEPYKNIEILYNHRVKEIAGEHKLEGVRVQKEGGDVEMIQVAGVFLYVAGNKPATEFLGNAVQLDEEGYVVVDQNLKTSVDGVFAGGDTRRTPLKQAVIAAADGAIAALGADKYINKRNRLIPQYS